MGKAEKGLIKKLFVAEIKCSDGSIFQIPVTEKKKEDLKKEAAKTKLVSKPKNPNERLDDIVKTVIKIRPFKSKEDETQITWDKATDIEVEGYQVATSDYVDQYVPLKAEEGMIQKLYVAEVNCTDGTQFQIPVLEEKKRIDEKGNARTKLVTTQNFLNEKSYTEEKPPINIRPYTCKKSETEISWDAASDFDMEGYQVASAEFVDKYTSNKAEEGKIKKLFIAEINHADGTMFQVPVVREKEDKAKNEVAQTKLVRKQKLPDEKLSNVVETVIKIRPYTSKESKNQMTWDKASEFDVEGYQVATSDLVERHTAHNAKKGTIEKLFVAEIKSSDGSIFQVPVVENKKANTKKEIARTKLVSKPKLPNEKLHHVIKTVIKIRPYTSKEAETQITWDDATEFDIEGYHIATSDFVDEYTSQKADAGMLQKLFIAEIDSTDGSMFQFPVVEDNQISKEKGNAERKLVSTQSYLNVKLDAGERPVVNIRPYKSKKSETQVSWDAASDFKVNGYQVANSDFVDQYAADKAEEGKIEKLFIAEISQTDGTKFQLPVIKDKDEKAKKETAQTKLVSKQKLPNEKLHNVTEPEIKIRPFTSKETETNLKWDMASDFDVDGYQIATSDFVDQYTAHDAKKGKIQKLFIAEIKCSDGSLFQVPVVEAKEETVKKEVAQTKLVSKPKLPNEKLQGVSKTDVKVRPYTSKETETQVTWDDTTENDIEGYHIATSDFVEQYTADKAEEGKINKLFIAEISHTDGSIFQVPVIKDKEEKAKKETAQTKLVSKQKHPNEKLHNVTKTEVKVRPFTSKETKTTLKWDMASDFDVDGYQVATSEFVDRYTAHDAKTGKIAK